eukprot:jgi/Mesen1/9652/ME000671S09017
MCSLTAEYKSRQPGERPDTLMIKGVPSRWLAEPRVSSKPSLLVTHTIFSAFGPIRNVDVVSEEEEGQVAAQQLQSTAVVQYASHAAFLAALLALLNRALRKEGSSVHARISVEWDADMFFSDKNVRRRKFDKERKEAELARRLQEAAHLKALQERHAAEAEAAAAAEAARLQRHEEERRLEEERLQLLREEEEAEEERLRKLEEERAAAEEEERARAELDRLQEETARAAAAAAADHNRRRHHVESSEDEDLGRHGGRGGGRQQQQVHSRGRQRYEDDAYDERQRKEERLRDLVKRSMQHPSAATRDRDEGGERRERRTSGDEGDRWHLDTTESSFSLQFSSALVQASRHGNRRESDDEARSGDIVGDEDEDEEREDWEPAHKRVRSEIVASVW